MENMNDDLISRQAAIDEIEYELEMIDSALDSLIFGSNARERLLQRKVEAREILNSIQQLPSAESETGERIEEDEYGDLWVCDQCGFASEHKDNYCPNCGARMKGRSDE